MHKRFAQWMWTNLVFALLPLICEVGFRWFGHDITYEAAENIPELAFVVGVLCLSAAADVSTVIDIIKDDKAAAGFVSFQQALYCGAVLAAFLFGGYTAISSHKEILEIWRPRMVGVVWLDAFVFMILAPMAEWAALKVIKEH